jgi:hypothetical protein
VSDGTGLRDEFLLDPSVTFLNHGSLGACLRPVFERYQEWQLELERQPVPIRLPVTSHDEIVGRSGLRSDRGRASSISAITRRRPMLLPIAEFCPQAREAGVTTVIDGAHVPGHIRLDLRALDPGLLGGQLPQVAGPLPRKRPAHVQGCNDASDLERLRSALAALL